MFVDFFIRRPIFAAVCSIMITLVGVIAIPTLPIAQYPELAPPQVTVTATYIGASAEVVETAVTIPLEQELNGVEGMRYIQSSTSGNDGTSDHHHHLRADAEHRRGRGGRAEPGQAAPPRACPRGERRRASSINKASSQLVLRLGLYTEHGRALRPKFLSNYADVNLRDALKRVQRRGRRAHLRRAQVLHAPVAGPDGARRGASSPRRTWSRALQEQNIQVAGRARWASPPSSGQPYQIAVRAQRPARASPRSSRTSSCSAARTARWCGCRDVGRAELGAENYGELLRFNGRSAVGLGIFQLPTANALDVRDGGARRAGAAVQAVFPPGMEYQRRLRHHARRCASRINEVLHTLGEAIVLVILVIFVFLHGWRSVLIPARHHAGVAGRHLRLRQAFGFSINTLTLFGLTLATGLVVDDAIVVIENIERFIQSKRLHAREAAREGMGEVAGAVVAISLVLVAVFVPVAFFPGTTGAIYRQFALTIALRVRLSAFCRPDADARAVAPCCCASTRAEGRFFREVDHGLDAAAPRLRGAAPPDAPLRCRRARWCFVACAGGAPCCSSAWCPTGFIPEEDQGYFIIAVQGPEGASLE